MPSTSPSPIRFQPGVTLAANATCSANGTSSCGTVTGTTGQTTLGATGAHIVPGGANSIVFLVPVSFAAGMSTNPLVNTASATTFRQVPPRAVRTATRCRPT